MYEIRKVDAIAGVNKGGCSAMINQKTAFLPIGRKAAIHINSG